MKKGTYSSGGDIEGVRLSTVNGSGPNLSGSASSKCVSQGQVSIRRRSGRDDSRSKASAKRHWVNGDGSRCWSTGAQRALGVQEAILMVASLAHDSQSSDGDKRNLGEEHCVKSLVAIELFS